METVKSMEIVEEIRTGIEMERVVAILAIEIGIGIETERGGDQVIDEEDAAPQEADRETVVVRETVEVAAGTESETAKTRIAKEIRKENVAAKGKIEKKKKKTKLLLFLNNQLCPERK